MCGSGSGPEVVPEVDAELLSVGSGPVELEGSVGAVEPDGAGPEVTSVLEVGATVGVGFTLLVGDGATGADVEGEALVVGLTGTPEVGEGEPLGLPEVTGVVLDVAGAGELPSVVEQPSRSAPMR